MGWNGTDMLTNGEHDRLWRKAFLAIPEIENQLKIMNKLKYIELIRDAGISNEEIREILTNIGKDVGYRVTFQNEEKKD